MSACARSELQNFGSISRLPQSFTSAERGTIPTGLWPGRTQLLPHREVPLGCRPFNDKEGEVKLVQPTTAATTAIGTAGDGGCLRPPATTP